MADPVAVSFEFFPPSDDLMGQHLWKCVQRLAPLRPRFVSVTYGADGSTRARTHECVLRIMRETNLTVAPHLTCVGASRSDVLQIAQEYWRQGVRHLVALRGDAPAANVARDGGYRPHAGGFAYASDLVAGLAGVGKFDVKVDAGAGRAITQFFFDTDIFLRYRDRCTAAGVQVRLVPGILPITRFPQLLRFAERCGAAVPSWLRQRFDGLDDDPDTRRLIAANVAIEQVQRLREHGVHEFHFYTLNRAELTYAICHALGLRPRSIESQVA